MSGRSGGSSSPTIEATYIVKLEFVQCALTVSRPLPNSYTPSALARVVVEAGSSVGDAFSLEKWITFGQTYLGLDARMCRVLFDRYLAIRDNRNEVLDSTRAQLSFEEMGTQAANNYEMQRSVHTPTFMMFLYLQLFHRTANIPANNTDSWLGGAVRHVALSQRTQDSDTFLTFLRRHMYDLLLCASLGQYKMTAEHVRHLTYLFHEYPPSPKDFGSEIPLWKQNSAQTLEISALHPYMQQHISSSAAWYPPLELPVAKSRPRVVWPDPGSTPNTRVAVLARIRGVFAKTIPPPNYVSQVCISSSSACSMYLLCSMPHVSLVGCSSCTIVLGSVGGVLTIEECENITVIATCSACHISNCTGVTLHACSNLQPVICGECTDIQLAPYNTYYNMLEMDMRIAGVNPLINKVLNFHNFSTNQAKSNIFAMAPREFTSTVIPLSAPPRSNTAPLTVANPCLMQKDYSDVIHQRAEVFSRTLQSVQKALSALHAEGTERSLQAATQLRTKIEARFASWVAQSGQQKVVLDMMQT